MTGVARHQIVYDYGTQFGPGNQMLRSGNTIRLAAKDIECLTLLTRERPSNIKSIDDLHRFIDAHAARHHTESAADRLMRFLLVREKITQP